MTRAKNRIQISKTLFKEFKSELKKKEELNAKLQLDFKNELDKVCNNIEWFKLEQMDTNTENCNRYEEIEEKIAEEIDELNSWIDTRIIECEGKQNKVNEVIYSEIAENNWKVKEQSQQINILNQTIQDLQQKLDRIGQQQDKVNEENENRYIKQRIKIIRLKNLFKDFDQKHTEKCKEQELTNSNNNNIRLDDQANKIKDIDNKIIKLKDKWK